MNIQDLLQWWNLIYAAPLLISVVWILASAVSGFDGVHGDHDFSDTDTDADVDADAGHDIAHDGHMDAAVHSHSAGHVDLIHDGAVRGGDLMGHHHDHSPLSPLFAFLGIGQVPISLMIGIFLFCWGAFGLAANQGLASIMKYPAIYIWPSIAVTLAFSFIVTRVMVALISRIMPTSETFAVSHIDLVGSLGRVIHTATENTGTIDIKDIYGTIHRVQAKTDSGQEALPPGTEAIVIDYDENDKRFLVRRSTL